MISDRIIYVGRNTRYNITKDCFKTLAKSLSQSQHKLVAVIVSSEEGSSSLADIAQSFNIPFLTPKNDDINDPVFVSDLKNFKPTIMLTVQFPAIYKKQLIKVPSRACLNIHRGWPLRGGSIDQRAIINKNNKYSVVLHHIDEGIDTGPILGKVTFDIDVEREDGFTLDRKVTKAGVELMKKEFIPLLGNVIKSVTPQNRFATSYENKWSEAKKTITPNVMNFEEAKRLIRALHHPREKSALLKINNQRYRVTKIVRDGEKETKDSSLNISYIRVKFKDCMGLCFINKYKNSEKD